MKQFLTFEQLPEAVTILTKEVSELKQLLLSKADQHTTYQQEQLFTIQEAAKFLNLTVPTIYSKVSKGELPFMKRGKRLHFSSTELMQYLREGRKKTNSEVQAEALTHLKKSVKA
jgi:excisionase family DNA binding protein